jgi:tol-pal system protein YbgF
MKHLILPLIAMLALPVFGQKKEIAEMQRDILLMQDQIRSLQRSQDEKLAALQVLIQQTLETSNKANTAVAVLESSMKDRFKEQERTIAVPITSVGTKVDTMATDFVSVREAVADLSSRVGKLQNQLTDMSNAVKTLSMPRPDPPPPAGGASTTAGGPPQGVSAESLYNAAMRDRSAGNADLAILQFEDYLKWFPNTDIAPNAQYYIGEIKYLRGDMDGALKEFDKLLEAFPDNAKTSDAMLLKGRALVKSGFKAEARQEFNALIKKFPSHENAAKARIELAALSAPARAPARSATKRRE